MKRIRSLNGGQSSFLEMLVNDNQTIVKGDLLYVTGGKVSKVGAAASAIIGLAGAPITTTTATDADKIPVELIDEFTVLETATADTFAATDLFVAGIYDLTSAQAVDKDDVTGGVFKVIAFETGKVQGVISAAKLWNV
jgi:hypothetical protein